MGIFAILNLEVRIWQSEDERRLTRITTLLRQEMKWQKLQHRFICTRKLIWKQIEMGRLP